MSFSLPRWVSVCTTFSLHALFQAASMTFCPHGTGPRKNWVDRRPRHQRNPNRIPCLHSEDIVCLKLAVKYNSFESWLQLMVLLHSQGDGQRSSRRIHLHYPTQPIKSSSGKFQMKTWKSILEPCFHHQSLHFGAQQPNPFPYPMASMDVFRSNLLSPVAGWISSLNGY